MTSQRRNLIIGVAILGIGLCASAYNYVAGNFGSPKPLPISRQEIAAQDSGTQAFEVAYVTIDKDLYDAIINRDSLKGGAFVYPVISNEISASEIAGNAENEKKMQNFLKKSHGELVLKERSVACLMVRWLQLTEARTCFLEAERQIMPPDEILGPGWIGSKYTEDGTLDTTTHDLVSIDLGKMRSEAGLYVPLFILYGYGAHHEDFLTTSAVSGIVYSPKYIRYEDENGNKARMNIAAIMEKPMLLHSD